MSSSNSSNFLYSSFLILFWMIVRSITCLLAFALMVAALCYPSPLDSWVTKVSSIVGQYYSPLGHPLPSWNGPLSPTLGWFEADSQDPVHDQYGVAPAHLLPLLPLHDVWWWSSPSPSFLPWPGDDIRLSRPMPTSLLFCCVSLCAWCPLQLHGLFSLKLHIKRHSRHTRNRPS